MTMISLYICLHLPPIFSRLDSDNPIIFCSKFPTLVHKFFPHRFLQKVFKRMGPYKTMKWPIIFMFQTG